MQALEISEIIRNIESQKTFEATAADGSFEIKIHRYVPFCCMAIHDGGNFRSDLKSNVLVDDFERWYEEDPHTGKFISSLPITIIGQDSRFEYDLNREPEECVYEEAWGKKVWKRKLTAKQRQVSLKKHTNFYKVVHALLTKLNHLYRACVVYDLHSYNYRRWERDVPLFNVGTDNVDVNKFAPIIENWKGELSKIDLTGIENTTALNDTFFGNGYNLKFITQNFPNTLVLATEVKKVYCDELSGVDYPEVITEVQHGLKQAILSNAQFFSHENTNTNPRSVSHLLDRKLDPAIVSVDRKMFRLLRGFELLAHVNPSNSSSEQRRFFKSKYTELPKFKYSPIKIHPFELKQKLGTIRTQDISDVSIRGLYEDVINSHFDKIDLLSTLGTRKFLYNSLRYFGRPSKKDLQNAQYILHLPTIPSEPKRMPIVPMEQAVEAFRAGLKSYDMNCKIEMSNRVISQVMVLNSKKTIMIRPDAKFTHKEINALIEHEIGVHMVTTQNSARQKLKIFNLGLPVNTMTQEGIAILSEYLSGNMTLARLKKIALRVVVTDMMCSGATFIECFKYLVNDQGVLDSDAYTIVTRIFRGGGFTKDYLYLSGFIEILTLWKSGVRLKPLLVGKTSLEHYDVITEMIDREIIEKPKFLTKSLLEPKRCENGEIYDYIISGLK